jgi:beta-xylosidase
MMTRLSLCVCAALLLCGSSVRAAGEFRPGEVWADVDGKPIQAHSGGMLVRDGVYYWFGEDRTTRKTGVSCYSSRDLNHWKHEGVVFSPDAMPEDLRNTSFIERPKVIFNAKTGKYILWFHMEQRGYHYARAGVAVSDKLTGPFTFVHAIRPITDDIEYKDTDPDRQKEFGGTYRDMNLFVDDDGQAYAFYASEGNWTMYVVRLNEDFTGPQTPAVQGKTWSRILVRKMREAPAPFKFNNRYYLITSGCTGWAPNAADYAVADNILGPWESKGNPCVGPNADKTFGTQSTCVFPVAGKPGCHVFMADQWKPRQLSDSRYVWLPLVLKPDGSFTLEWRGAWDLSTFPALSPLPGVKAP